MLQNESCWMNAFQCNSFSRRRWHSAPGRFDSSNCKMSDAEWNRQNSAAPKCRQKALPRVRYSITSSKRGSKPYTVQLYASVYKLSENCIFLAEPLTDVVGYILLIAKLRRIVLTSGSAQQGANRRGFPRHKRLSIWGVEKQSYSNL